LYKLAFRYIANILLSSLFLSTVLLAKTDKSCKDLSVGLYSYNPYDFHFIRVKAIQPKVQKFAQDTIKSSNKAQDVIDKYVKINSNIRYKKAQKETIEPNKNIKYYISIAKQLKTHQSYLLAKLIQEEELRFEKSQSLLKEYKYQQALKLLQEKQKNQYGYYTVKAGDTISHIAYMFGLRIKDVVKLNDINTTHHIRVNQNIKLPYTQEQIEVISTAKYKVKKGDNLHTIAKAYDLKVSDIIDFNHYKSNKILRIGEIVKLPLPYIQDKTDTNISKIKKLYANKNITRFTKFGQHRLKVIATAYTSHSGQTDTTPFLAAWNNRIRPGMKIIAVSRDLLHQYGLKNGSRVKISGLNGYYTVRDKMNKRYKKRIDIYMGINRRQALKWGRKSVVIYW